MHAVVITLEGVTRARVRVDGTAYAGRCPACRGTLIVDTRDADVEADAVCFACGAIVGRVVLAAHRTRRGNVEAERRNA